MFCLFNQTIPPLYVILGNSGESLVSSLMSLTGMCNEVLLRICEQLDNTRYDTSCASGYHTTFDKGRSQDLIHLGVTCRLFFKPAMAVLWKNMNSLVPLLKVIPNFVQVEGACVRHSMIRSQIAVSLQPHNRYFKVLSKRDLFLVSGCILATFEPSTVLFRHSLGLITTYGPTWLV